MQHVMSATEARDHFDDLIRRVHEDDETVVVTVDGGPGVVVLSSAAYKRLRATKDEPDVEPPRSDLGEWLVRVDRLRAEIARDLNGRPLPDITELLREMREEREEQLLANLPRRYPGGPDHCRRGRYAASAAFRSMAVR